MILELTSCHSSSPNSMKFSVDIEGWEWQDKGPWPYPVNQSYLQLGGVFGGTSNGTLSAFRLLL